MNGDHVKEAKRWMLSLTGQGRIDAILKHFWVSYPQADRIVTIVRNMTSTNGRVQAPCLMVSGDSGSGKSSLAKHIRDISHDWNIKVAFMSCVEKGDGMNFKESVVSALGAPNVPKWSARRGIPGELEKFIQLTGTRALIIDEFHDALLVQRPDQTKNLSFLKGLSGEPFMLTIIALGTPLAVNALRIDDQLFRRFDFEHLQSWEENEVFRSFLASIEENLPLKKPSGLYQKEIVKYLLTESKGNTATLLDIVRFGAIQAIQSGEECITVDLLKMGRSLRWMYGSP
ncbi:TniB family NTP-binding protein [Stutzerimonas stutzeri]|uniref:TniB family NTP-binding protein n=1 Tax=Stutzerimonas stutzeri TaxID=316 RepID=UPI003EE0667D|nr:TniB family NTP-binding protein [Gammaproteobacteria bacterium]